MTNHIRPTLVLFLFFTLLTGGIYPLIVTGIARACFPYRAGGSVIVSNDKPIGSDLIAQPFTDPRYFWSRPSAADYDATAGAGSNLGPTNPALTDAVNARIAALHTADPGNSAPVPVDLVTTSASGLDPHITLAAARYQIARIAKARGLTDQQLLQIVNDNVEAPLLGMLGEARVNVLKLNLRLDAGPTTQAASAQSGDIDMARGRGFLPDSK